jgi:uncharacterized protein YlxP (DUF503 family)
MVVGILRVVLALPWNDSLKGKRSVVRKIVERARSRFNVAAAELDDLDAHRRAVLGFVVLSNDRRHVTSMLDKLTSFVAGATEAQLVDRRVEVTTYSVDSLGLGGSMDAGDDDAADDPYADDPEDDEPE